MIGHRAEPFGDLERTRIAWPKLSLSAGVKGSCRLVEQAQPHPLAHLELLIAMAGIVVLLGDLLSLQQSLADLLKDLVPARQQCIHPLCLGGLTASLCVQTTPS
jgi:hypothetical protein